jgi:hypothetical protein
MDSKELAEIKARAEVMVAHVEKRGGAVLRNGIWETMVVVGSQDIPALLSEIERLKNELTELRKTNKDGV